MQKVEGSSPFSRSSEKPCNLRGFFVSGTILASLLGLGRTNRADQSATWRARISAGTTARGRRRQRRDRAATRRLVRRAAGARARPRVHALSQLSLLPRVELAP